MIIPEHEVTTDEVKQWQGIHLLHNQMSAPSQKVRILLRVKGIQFISHEVNTSKSENVTPWYIGINPRGVVPVLVHDGVVHVESNDILEHIDSLPSDAKPFFPVSKSERSSVDELLALESDLFVHMRALTVGFLVPKRMAQKSTQVLDKYESEGPSNPERSRDIAWWRAVAAHGITEAQAGTAVAAFRAAFDKLEGCLEKGEWLIGDRMSVLEIAWFISFDRLVLSGYPLEIHPLVNALYKRLGKESVYAEETRMPAPAKKVVLPVFKVIQRITGKRLIDVAREALA
jgi:glutathione S-transferase